MAVMRGNVAVLKRHEKTAKPEIYGYFKLIWYQYQLYHLPLLTHNKQRQNSKCFLPSSVPFHNYYQPSHLLRYVAEWQDDR